MRRMIYFAALLMLASYAAADDIPAGYTPPSEPDYEEEKLRFQRGSMFYYSLPQYDVKTDPADTDRLSARAARGDATAQIRLGIMSEQGKSVPQDYRVAKEWYEKAARVSADAQFLLGLMYYQGKGVVQDFAMARRWFGKAAKRMATPAQVNLGWMCEYGQGATNGAPDFDCARRWYAKAARTDVIGMYNTGNLYYLGKGVAQDYTQARRWFLQAAERNTAAAQYNLGVMALGQGQERDPVAAYQWFRLVKLAFYPGGTYNIDTVAGELSTEQLQRAEDWVAQWTASHRNR